MHVCLCLIYSKPLSIVLLSACECHEVSVSSFGLYQTGEQTDDHGQGESTHFKIMLLVLF